MPVHCGASWILCSTSPSCTLPKVPRHGGGGEGDSWVGPGGTLTGQSVPGWLSRRSSCCPLGWVLCSLDLSLFLLWAMANGAGPLGGYRDPVMASGSSLCVSSRGRPAQWSYASSSALSASLLSDPQRTLGNNGPPSPPAPSAALGTQGIKPQWWHTQSYKTWKLVFYILHAADPLSKTRSCQSACMASEGQSYSTYDECGFYRAKSSSTYISWEEMLLAVLLSTKTIKAARIVHRAVKVLSPCSRDKEAENTCKLVNRCQRCWACKQWTREWILAIYLLTEFLPEIVHLHFMQIFPIWVGWYFQ